MIFDEHIDSSLDYKYFFYNNLLFINMYNFILNFRFLFFYNKLKYYRHFVLLSRIFFINEFILRVDTRNYFLYKRYINDFKFSKYNEYISIISCFEIILN
jgi:hypothetical protein